MNRYFRPPSFITTAVLAALVLTLAGPVRADKIKHPIAVFSGLDKITGRTIAFQAATGETVQFGTLQITERACYTRPATEAPQTTTFVEVDEIDADKKYKRIFSGWMFAASPGLHGIEHPIYDIWLTDCTGGAAEPEASTDTGVQVDLQPPATPEAPQTPAQEPSPPRKGHSNKKRTPIAKVPLDAPPQEPQDAEPSPMDTPIEVGRPPGLIPAPQDNQ